MSLSKKDKKYIRNNYKELGAIVIAKKLKTTEKAVEDYATKQFGNKTPTKKISVNQENKEEFRSIKDIYKFLLANKLYVAILLIVPAVVYANSIFGEFVSDDIPGYVQNPVAQNLSLALKQLNLGNIIYSIFYALFKLNPVPLHLFSLTLHLSTVLLFFIFFSWMFNKKLAFYATLLFSVHPVNTETVDWISAKSYSMMAIFITVSLILYLLYRNSDKKLYFSLSLIIYSFAAVTMQDPRMLLTPVFFVVAEFFLKSGRLTKKVINDYLVIGGLTLLYGFVMFNQQYVQRLQTLETMHGFSPEQSAPFFLRVPYSVFMTLYLFVFPKDLTLYHEGSEISRQLFVIMVLVTVIFFAVSIWLFFANKKLAGLIIFALAALAPMLSPIQIGWLIAERYLYMASMVFCLFLAMLFFRMEKVTRKRNLALYMLVFLVSVYSARTMIRNYDWSTRERLWWSTAMVAPNSYRAYNNLGDVYSEKKQYPVAAYMFTKSIQLFPTYAEAWHNLGTTYLQMGQDEVAKQYILYSFQLKPILHQSTYKLGLIEYSRQNYELARAYFMKTLEIDPQFTPAYEALRAVEQEMVQ